ncbi:MAG: hypothetical protein AAF333_13130 [Planctomycetota bacterium]
MTHAIILLAQSGSTATPVGGEGPWLVWGIVLIAVAVALFFVEVFLPTGGVIGVASGVAAIAGVVMLFRFDSTLGLLAAAACLAALPFLIGFALKIWPDTPFGRWVMLNDAQEAVNQHDGEPSSRRGAGHAGAGVAVGDTGKTLTPLFPVGTCLIGGERCECLAKRGTIDAGAKIRVVVVDGSEVYVEEVGGEQSG